LRLVTSPNHLYKKLEEYGVDHDEIIKSMVKNDAKWLVSRKEEDDSKDTSASVTDAKPSAGFKLTIDNVDYTQNVHYMTEEHQNNDKHYVSINATVNRVSSNHLSDESTANGINQMENGKCIPNHFEQKAHCPCPTCNCRTCSMPWIWKGSFVKAHPTHVHQRDITTNRFSKYIQEIFRFFILG
jgi:hypothetical protein